MDSTKVAVWVMALLVAGYILTQIVLWHVNMAQAVNILIDKYTMIERVLPVVREKPNESRGPKDNG